LFLLVLFVQAASALHLSPRPAWLSSFLAASQPKLQHLDAAQLASLASAVAALAAAASSSSSSSSNRREQGSKQQQQGETVGVKVSGSWIKAWMECSKQRLSELQTTLREQEQAAAAAAAAAEAAAADGTGAAEGEKEGEPAGGKAAAAGKVKTAPTAAAAAVAPGALIGQLALAAVELGVLSKPPTVAAAAGKGPTGGVLPQSFGPSTAERISWVAALAAAAATAAAAVKSKALNAAAASQILAALAAQQQEQPGLLLQLDAQFRQQAGSSGSNASYVLSIVAAVAAAAKGSMWSGGSEVLMRLLRAMVTFGVQPGRCFALLWGCPRFCYVALLQQEACVQACLDAAAQMEQGGAAAPTFAVLLLLCILTITHTHTHTHIHTHTHTHTLDGSCD
jgi:hypothetical protein